MPHPIQARYCTSCGLPLPAPDTPCLQCVMVDGKATVPPKEPAFEGEDERNYQQPAESLNAKPGYPYNTNPHRPIPRVRYEASREELLEKMQHGAAFGDDPGGNLTDKAQGIELDEWTPQIGQNAAQRLLQKLDPGEPVFVIRGNDISAHMFVQAWATLQSLNPSPPHRKIAMARRIGLAMDQWKNKRWPD